MTASRAVALALAAALAASRAAALTLTASSPTALPGGLAQVDLNFDQPVDALAVYSLDYRLELPAGVVSGVQFVNVGLITTWGLPFENPTTSFAAASGGGTAPVTSTSLRLHGIQLLIASGAAPGDYPLTLSAMHVNGGSVPVTVVNGTLHVRNTVGVEAGVPSLALAPCVPDPAVNGTLVAFSLPADATALAPFELALFDLGGRRVRTLAHGALAAGPHALRWDGRADDGARAAPGLYWVRLAWRGRQLVRRIVIAR